MHWRAAQPDGAGLLETLSLHPACKLAFCGGTVAGAGFGRVEGARLSGDHVSRHWRDWLKT